MKLIEVLVSGVNGASGGTVDVYKRGTQTRAAIYSNFIGTTVNTPTASLPLDGNGGTSIYVNEYVDCVVKDSSGNIIRSFTAGEAATDVEVISTSFTGTDYVSGLAAASKPIALSAILDKLLASFGTTDWNVLINGSSKTLQAAVAGVSGLAFNVKDATYGAVGDGIVDDTAAIQAAFTAAGVKGGIVFFPGSSVYRIVSAITVPANVSILGTGGMDQAAGGTFGSTLSIDHASNSALSFSNASTSTQTVRGLCVRAKQSHTGVLVTVGAAVKLSFEACYLGSSITTTGKAFAVSAGAAKVVFNNCYFEVGGAGGHIVTTTGIAECYGCTFIHPTGAYGATTWLSVGGGVAVGCFFENASISSGGATNISWQGAVGGTPNLVLGCFFPNPGGGTVTAIDDSTSGAIHEFGNSFGSSVVNVKPLSATGNSANRDGYQALTRLTRAFYISSNAASVTVDPITYGHIRILRTTNANATVDIGTLPTPGMMFFLVYDNFSGGNIATVTVSGTGVNTATFALNSGLVQIVPFVAVEYNNKCQWNVACGLPSAFGR